MEHYLLLISSTHEVATKFLDSVQVGDQTSMALLEAEHFDFGITEIFGPCGYAVFSRIGLKNYATAFATDLCEVLSDPLGVSSNPSWVPG
ncbi:unnamed protein product [Gongylonema pulchrum]|uniref:GCV_T domain-containing protein n=1 Tax=Gongylonema pulchrum TaxID=637853 RepID=A0A183CW01_9BILA|nr:unnamed protein product [Gongylonema pulchrum]